MRGWGESASISIENAVLQIQNHAGIQDDVVIQGANLLLAGLVEAVQNVVGKPAKWVEACFGPVIPADICVGVIGIIPCLVKPDRIAAVNVALHFLLHEVIRIRGRAQIGRSVRQRYQCQCGGGERRDSSGGNHVPRKRRAVTGSRIYSRRIVHRELLGGGYRSLGSSAAAAGPVNDAARHKAGLTEIALPLQQRRNGHKARIDRGSIVDAGVGEEEEGLPFATVVHMRNPYRPSHSPAVLIGVNSGSDIVSPGFCVQKVVQVVFVQAAVEVFGSRLADHVDGCAALASDGCVIGIGGNTKFGDRVLRGYEANRATGTGVVRAIQSVLCGLVTVLRAAAGNRSAAIVLYLGGSVIGPQVDGAGDTIADDDTWR